MLKNEKSENEKPRLFELWDKIVYGSDDEDKKGKEEKK